MVISHAVGCPTLADLPAPPAGRSGWPWTHESRRAGTRMIGGVEWPRISIVTPSFGQGEYIEETIRSVLLQGYPNLEYIVMDGGSDDGTLEIIERYERWLTFWASEPDDGQSHAINKGFRRSTGSVLAWLNSDDTYFPGALQRVARILSERGADILVGSMSKVEDGPGGPVLAARSSPTRGTPMHPLPIYANIGRGPSFHFMQPSMFWRRSVWEAAGELDQRYHYVMDQEWCTRAIATGATVATTESVLARFRLHPAAKTQHLLPRALRERSLMYVRLSATRGFRRVDCLLAALIPLRRSLVLEARRLQMNGRRAAPIFLRACARLLLLGLGGLSWLTRSPVSRALASVGVQSNDATP